jgi:MFS family permease
MDLYCSSSIQIGFIGSTFLIGTFVGSFIFPRLADIVGRKPIFIIGLVLYIIDTVGFIFCDSLELAYLLLFIGGLAETGAYYVAYVYCVEMMPEVYQNLGGLSIFLVFAFVKMFFSIYFWFLSKNWIGMAIIALVTATISLVLTIFIMPDTPRYLYSNKKFDKVREVLKFVQKLNGCTNVEEFVFDTEVKERGKSESMSSKDLD